MLSQKTKEFNEYLTQSDKLQVKFRKINSPIELIKLAKEEGFELSMEDFKELANHAYQQWSNQLNENTRLFFAKVHLTPEINQKLYQCQSKKDVLNLAQEYGFNLVESDINLADKIAQSIQGFSFEKIFFNKIL